MMFALACGADFSHQDGWADLHPPFLFSLSCERKEKRAVHGPKRKENARARI